ncbi:MAG: PxKF domain-containing protein [Nitrososphaera sp.]|nr:PxKF domain-containing protein [Nitrososphaera sp.]
MEVHCVEASSPFGLAEVIVPENAEYLSFEYRFVSTGDGDYAAVLLDDLPIWVLSGLSTVQEGEFADSGPIPIRGLTGHRKLTIALYGVGQPNAEFEIQNFKTAAGPKMAFNFTGFFPPVDSLPTLNTAKAGSAVPVKFSLNGDQGLDIFAAGSPSSQQITCDASATADGIEETVTAGGSSLTYDPTADHYIYVWKTNKAWAGTCRQFNVHLKDGSDHQANFRFTR